ncbi:ParA family protein [Selenomonas sp.]|uniref:ParA family protein n=1 Tax=Selenomonas sp. TaxID=2053611 RepID=UPI002A7582AC|nr:AAA family ATPase [Selenomonas sp.]MDY3296765.1 AAA family ATPase [Selenomonas sp.]
MQKIITVANRKGGVGKTTTAAAMASCLKKKGFRVLLVDLDSQCNLSSNVGADVRGKNVLDVFLRKAKTKDTIQQSSICDIIAGSLDFGKINDALGNKTGREYRLIEGLVSIKDDYDFCIIDTPPELGIATTNAMTASDDLIIPTTAESFSLDGVSQLYENVQEVWQYTNQDMKIAGILVTLYNNRAILAKNMREELVKMADEMNTKVFKQTIRRSISVAEAQQKEKDLLEYAGSATATQDYEAWIEEYLEG